MGKEKRRTRANPIGSTARRSITVGHRRDRTDSLRGSSSSIELEPVTELIARIDRSGRRNGGQARRQRRHLRRQRIHRTPRKRKKQLLIEFEQFRVENDRERNREREMREKRERALWFNRWSWFPGSLVGLVVSEAEKREEPENKTKTNSAKSKKSDFDWTNDVCRIFPQKSLKNYI